MKRISLTAMNHLFALATSSVLCAVLFICANTTSCTLIHQPDSPANLHRFSRVK